MSCKVPLYYATKVYLTNKEPWPLFGGQGLLEKVHIRLAEERLFFAYCINLSNKIQYSCLMFVRHFLFVHVSANTKAVCVCSFREDYRFGVERILRQ